MKTASLKTVEFILLHLNCLFIYPTLNSLLYIKIVAGAWFQQLSIWVIGYADFEYNIVTTYDEYLLLFATEIGLSICNMYLHILT